MKKYIPFSMLAAVALLCAACSDSKSYAELLNEENRVVNLFLAEHRVVDHIPADSVFEKGPGAPYYQIDEEGNVYMQVLDEGSDKKPEKGDRVYFRYMRYMLDGYVVGGNNVGVGNADNMNTASTFFLLDDEYVSESTQYGTGIQLPMHFLGYDCKVNLVIKSQAGPTADMSYVAPYLYNISYYPPRI